MWTIGLHNSHAAQLTKWKMCMQSQMTRIPEMYILEYPGERRKNGSY